MNINRTVLTREDINNIISMRVDHSSDIKASADSWSERIDELENKVRRLESIIKLISPFIPEELDLEECRELI